MILTSLHWIAFFSFQLFVDEDWQETEALVLEELELKKDESIELPAFQNIRIKSLIAREGARIQFPVQHSGASADWSSDGGNGGSVLLFVDKLDGHIVVEARGGDGGVGRDGRDGQMGARGSRGRDARRLFFFWLGPGERGGHGRPGENGEAGENGGDGGKGGRIQIYIQEKLPGSQVLVDVSGGKGGAAGRGGRGGLGGPGGPGGRGWMDGPQGRMGEPGSPGNPGRPGRPGAPGESLILQLSPQQYLCAQLWELKALSTEEALWDCFAR